MVMSAIWDLFFEIFILPEPEGRVQSIKSRQIYPILHEHPCYHNFITCFHCFLSTLIGRVHIALTVKVAIALSCTMSYLALLSTSQIA